jgi:hypothetical protein
MEANNLAYYITANITVAISFIVQVPVIITTPKCFIVQGQCQIIIFH